jgi:hypothetical protein
VIEAWTDSSDLIHEEVMNDVFRYGGGQGARGQDQQQEDGRNKDGDARKKSTYVED